MNNQAGQKPNSSNQNQNQNQNQNRQPVNVPPPTVDSANAGKDSGLFSKLGSRFNTALQNNRGAEGAPPPPKAPQSIIPRPTEDLAAAKARGGKVPKMYIPEGVIIQGSLSGAAETEIHGRVEGNVSVDGGLYLGRNAVVAGNVHASSCQIDGKVDGSVDCVEDLILNASGHLAADASAGKQVRISGNIEGNVSTPGTLRIEAGGVVNGDVKARVFSMSEGAVLNGRCTMRTTQETLFSASEKREKD